MGEAGEDKSAGGGVMSEGSRASPRDVTPHIPSELDGLADNVKMVAIKATPDHPINVNLVG